MTPSCALRIEQLGVNLGGVRLLDGVSLDIAAGERLALIGPNGAGKTTVFHALTGQVRPTSGRVNLFGRRIDGWSPARIRRAGLSRSFQVSQLFDRMSVEDHLRAAWWLSQGSGVWPSLACLFPGKNRAIEHWVASDLERLNLKTSAHLLAGELSYADRRALELGLAAVGDAPVLLLDEPTAGMSRSETQRFQTVIRDLTAGRTLVMIEHDMGVVFDLADRVAVLVGGRLLACDRPAKIRAHPEVQRAYLGALMNEGAPATRHDAAQRGVHAAEG